MPHFSDNAITMYKNLYVNNDETSPIQVHERVAKFISSNENEYDVFLNLLNNNIFRPNTPCLINAGNKKTIHDGNLVACFVLDIKDSMPSIVDMWSTCAKVYAGGGGAGLPISNLREKGSTISTGGKASGPIKYLEVVQSISDTVKSGGKTRRAANLVSFKINHPDIKEYITCKDHIDLSAINISVLVDDNFMRHVYEKEFEIMLPLISPNKNEKVGEISIGELWTSIINQAWKTGDPGLLFYDAANNNFPLRNRGDIVTTNPCLPSWAPVLTPNGYRRFRDVQNIIYINGNIQQCSDLIKTGEDVEVYEIELKNGLSIYATEDHLISTNKGDVQLKELDPKKHKIKMDYDPIKYEMNENNWNRGFLSGYLFAEGTIIKNNNISFSLGIEEFSIESFCTTLINSELKCNYIYNNHYQTNNCKIINIASNTAKEEMFKIFGTTSKDNFDLISADKDISYQIGFISAMMTFDGSVTFQDSHSSYKSCIHQSGERGYKILKNIQIILASLGVYSNLSLRNKASQKIRNNKIWNYKETYTLEIIDNKEFAKHIRILSPQKDNRLKQICKLDRPVSDKRIKKRKESQEIKSIRLFSIEDVFDIQVPNIHHFVTCGAIVHNCGEVTLPPNSCCNLGSINLNKCLDENNVFSLKLFEEYIQNSILFLDNVISKTTFPTEDFEKTMYSQRPIGLGIMGFGDILYRKNIRYGSEESLKLFDSICYYLTKFSLETSIDVVSAGKRTPISLDSNEIESMTKFLKHHNVSDNHIDKFLKHGIRNSTVTSIAPTGSISISCDCCYAFEPIFALIWSKTLVDTGETLYFTNEYFEKACSEKGIVLTKELKQKIAKNKGSCQGIDEIPKEIQEVYVTAHDVGWKKKIEMQAIGQRHITLAISSTCNLPNSATVEDVHDAYVLAWKSKLKGITVYRDGCLDWQPVNFGGLENAVDIIPQLNPMKRPMIRDGKTIEFLTPNGKIYMTGNHNSEGKLFEVFIRMGEQGHITNIMLDGLGRVISKSLQYGVPLDSLIDTLSSCGGLSFFFKIDENEEKSHQAKSIVDAISKIIDHHFNPNKVKVESDENLSLTECPSCHEITLSRAQGCRGGICVNPKCGHSSCS